MKHTGSQRKVGVVMSITLLLPGIFALPAAIQAKLESAASPGNLGPGEDFDLEHNYPSLDGTGKGFLKFLSDKNSGENVNQYIDGDDTDWKNKMKSTVNDPRLESYLGEIKDRNWSDNRQDKRAEDPAQDGSRYLSDYDEYVYSLRAIPYLFKKKSETDDDSDQPEKKYEAMSALFKRMLQDGAQDSASAKPSTDDHRERELAARNIPSLFKRYEGERGGVPFLFRRDQPYIVRHLLNPDMAAKSIPFLFRKTLRTLSHPVDRKTRMDALFRRDDQPEFANAKESNGMSDKSRVISSLF